MTPEVFWTFAITGWIGLGLVSWVVWALARTLIQTDQRGRAGQPARLPRRCLNRLIWPWLLVALLAGVFAILPALLEFFLMAEILRQREEWYGSQEESQEQ